MYSIKPGRGPSGLSAFFGVFAVIFGIGWTVMAYSMTENAPFPMVHLLFPLFGVVFIVVGIVNVIYNARNATAKNRFSVVDITTDGEEPDPLNRQFGAPSAPAAESVETRLGELAELKKKGLISETEFATQRQRILSQL